MSTTKSPGSAQRLPWFIGMAAGAVVALVIAWLLDRAGRESVAAGVLAGALLVLVLAALGRWRTLRRADRAGTAARIGGGAPDERDSAVLTSNFAYVGWFGLLASSLSVAAMFLGADPRVLVSGMPFALIGASVLAFVLINRRS